MKYIFSILIFFVCNFSYGQDLLNGYILGTGDTIGLSVTEWERDSLNGNDPFVIDTIIPNGYADISSIILFDKYGLSAANVSVVRTAIDTLFQATTFSALSTLEKEVVSKWFLATITDRNSVHTASEQKENAQILVSLLSIESIINTANDIKDAEPSAIAETVNEASAPSSPLEWLDIQRKSATNDQTGIDEGTDIILDSANGNIPYNSTTGIATLKAGKVYVLWFTVAVFSIGSSETVAIQWVKASDNSPLYEGHETRLRPQSSTSNGNNQPTIKVIYKSAVDTDVKLRCTEYTGTPDTVSMYWDRSMATINELR